MELHLPTGYQAFVEGAHLDCLPHTLLMRSCFAFRTRDQRRAGALLDDLSEIRDDRQRAHSNTLRGWGPLTADLRCQEAWHCRILN